MCSAQLLWPAAHQLQEFHRAALLQQEILVHDEERFRAARRFRFLHHPEQLRAGGVQVEDLALAAEERRRGAEVATQRAAHGRDDGRRGIGLVGDPHAHHAQVEAGIERRMVIGAVGSSPRYSRIQAMPSPFTMWSASTMCSMPRSRRDMPADDDRGIGRDLADHAAHLAHLADVDDDGRDADDVVLVRVQFAREGLASGKVEDRAGRRDVLLDHQDAPGAVEAAQREGALRLGHLVVIQLHRIDGAAAEFIVLRVGTEDRRQQDPRRTFPFGWRRNRRKYGWSCQ